MDGDMTVGSFIGHNSTGNVVELYILTLTDHEYVVTSFQKDSFYSLGNLQINCCLRGAVCHGGS